MFRGYLLLTVSDPVCERMRQVRGYQNSSGRLAPFGETGLSPHLEAEASIKVVCSLESLGL